MTCTRRAFHLFVQWFNAWKQHREQNQSLTSYNTVAAQKEFTE